MTRRSRRPFVVPAPRDTTNDLTVRTALEQLVGATMLTRSRSTWGFSGTTDIATFANGRSLALKRIARGRRGENLIDTYRSLAPRILACGVGVPPFVVGLAWPRGPILLVTDGVGGSFGPQLIAQIPEGRQLARSMGLALRRLRNVQVDGISLASGWHNVSALRGDAQLWLSSATRWIEPEISDQIGSHLEGFSELFPSPDAVFAHGDYCPANILAHGSGSSVTILDLDTARLANPLLDVAWWGATVWHHHPDVFDAIWPDFLEGAGVDETPPAIDRLRTLAVIRTLESLATRSKSERHAWISRLITSLHFPS